MAEVGRTSVVELAEEWLERKRLSESDDQLAKGNSDRARRADLARWGRLIAMVAGRSDGSWPRRFELVEDLGEVELGDLADIEMLSRALAAGRTRFSAASTQRMLATMRGFLRWLARQGYVTRDLSHDDELHVRSEHSAQVRSLSQEETDQMLATARLEGPKGSRMWWPVRDIAVLEVLAGCGLRASETCAARVSWIDRQPDVPIMRVRGAKGAKDREVPIPTPVDAALRTYLEERSATEGPEVALAAPLFVRRNGRELNPPALDRIVRLLAQRAGVALPPGAAAHSFRHTYATRLALAGVHGSVIQQLLGHESASTTAIYTRVASRDLIAAMKGAGVLG